MVLEHGGNEDEAIAAMLHDAVEDRGGEKTLQQIKNQFGIKVAEIVRGCTDNYEIPKPPWRTRKESYIQHLANAFASIRLVSNADKLHNARAILNDLRVSGESLWKRFNGGKEGTIWYYKSLANTFKELNNGALPEELDRVVREIGRISQVE